MLKKVPNPIDRHVGSRVRMRRLLVGVSQEKLGDGLGLTFQQVQKYEKGSNRISASRLQQIAGLLEVPVSFFFEGAPAGTIANAPQIGSAVSEHISDFLATSEGVQLAKAFATIKNARVRRRLIDLAEALSEDSSG